MLILVAKLDGVVGYKDILKLDKKLSQATVGMINLAGHGLQCEQVAIFNALTHNWLQFLND